MHVETESVSIHVQKRIHVPQQQIVRWSGMNPNARAQMDILGIHVLIVGHVSFQNDHCTILDFML